MLAIDNFIEEKLKTFKISPDKYSLRQYYSHHDFRIGLSHSVSFTFGKILGVDSRLSAVCPVLSIGTNVVTVAEIAKLYQSFIEGKTYSFYEDGGVNELTFLEE